MKVSRRDFFKLSGVTLGAATLAGLGHNQASSAYGKMYVQYAREVTTICPYCSLGCGIICYVQDGNVIGAEGDPDHPINEGSLCSKGSSLLSFAYIYDQQKKLVPHPGRLQKVLYRAPYAKEFHEKDWDWALEQVAKRIKKTRDETFEITDDNGVTVNRTRAITHLGSAACTNEENYLYHKMLRSLGVISMDHCARL